MGLFDLIMAGLALFGGLWVTFRMRAIDPRARLLGAIVGAAIIAMALYQGLGRGSPFSGVNAPMLSSHAEALSAPTRILAHAGKLFLVMAVAMTGVLVFYAVYFFLTGRNRGVLRTRMPTTLRNVICVGGYMFTSILPMSLEKHHVLHLTSQADHLIEIAYISLVVVVIVVAMGLAFEKSTRHRKATAIAFFCGLVIVAGSSPFVWAVYGTALPAVAQPIGVLSVLVMAAPGPAYYLLRYQLGWL
jgi:hypothetical protein